MIRKQRYRCQDCQGIVARGSARCKKCAARHAVTTQGKRLLPGVSRDEDYRPTAAELVRVARRLARLEARRRLSPRRLTVEDIWARAPLPCDEEYAAFSGAQP